MSVNRRKRAWIVVAAAVLVGMAGTILYQPYWAQRRALRKCLAGIPNYNALPHPWEGLMTNQATETLRQMGPKVVPQLAKMLCARDSDFDRRAKDFLNRLLSEQSYITFRFPYAADERRAALSGVYVLGPGARAALPAAKKVLEDGLETWQALLAIARGGPEGVPILIEALTNRTPSVRQGAAGLLTHFREQADLIVPALITCLDDPDAGFRSVVPFHLASFGRHPVIDPLVGQSRLHLILPRTVSRLNAPAQPADAPRVTELAFSGPKSFLLGDQNTRRPYPVMVAVEKGAIKGVATERGATRMLVVGDSIFLANHQIDSAGNRDFANYALNWLLDRPQLLLGIGPKSVTEYRLAMTRGQLQSTQLLLLAGMPGTVLLLAAIVWLRRRR